MTRSAAAPMIANGDPSGAKSRIQTPIGATIHMPLTYLRIPALSNQEFRNG